MDLERWDSRYRTGKRRAEDLGAPPTPLVQTTAAQLRPGMALDLAAGAGRNTLWLATQGWRVSAVDGASAAIEILRERAVASGLAVDTEVADLAGTEYLLSPNSFDLVLICYYLQRNLFVPAKAAVRPGGTLVAIVHITEGSEEATANRLRPGELRNYFQHWNITHYYEGEPRDTAHKRAAAEIVALRPIGV